MRYEDAPPLTKTWLACPRAAAKASVRLVCFHHAGGSPTSFRPWLSALPAHVELLAVRLPGREARLRETPLTAVDAIVGPLAEALAPLAPGVRVVLFGHSLGALLAFEFARELRRRGQVEPAGLVVSGRNAPSLGRSLDLHKLRDHELIAEVQRIYGGIPQAILNEPELLALTLPVLRADLTLNEAHTVAEEPPLAAPICAYAGIDDPHVGRAGLEAWAEQTEAAFDWAQTAGEHFYLSDAPGRSFILAKLAPLLTPEA